MATQSKNTKYCNPPLDHLSVQEVDSIGEALKQPEFRSLLRDYVQEVADPANVAIKEREMAALEAAKGIHCTFLRPQPGYVIKTRSLREVDEKKVFVNICSNEHVQAPENRGHNVWAVPYSTSKPRRDVDRCGQPCVVYDVLFHPNALALASRHPRVKDVVNQTALEGIEKAFPDTLLDKDNLKYPKLRFKGAIHSTVIRRPMDKDVDDVDEGVDLKESKKTPEYTLKYRDNMELPTRQTDNGVVTHLRPSEIVVEVSLPEMSSAKGVDLDVLEHQLTLESDLPVAYYLKVKFPYPVDEDKGSARFDRSTKKLVVTLPVKRGQRTAVPVSRLVSTDSGIEIDLEAEPQEDDAYRTLSEEGLVMGQEEEDSDNNKVLLPPYTCNIYEGLMVFTLNVRNVMADSFEKTTVDDGRGYRLSFSTLGQGFVAFQYGFCMLFDDSSAINCSMDDLEVEVWDNNIIVQLSMPEKECASYRVGTDKDTVGEPIPLPQLRAVRQKSQQLKKSYPPVKMAHVDSDDSSDDSSGGNDEGKERHSSGESQDSALSVSPPSKSDDVVKPEEPPVSPSKRFLVTRTQTDCYGSPTSSLSSNDSQPVSFKQQQRGILKNRTERGRCFSESQADQLRVQLAQSCSVDSVIREEEEEGSDKSSSKKSVRFNEVVQRQIFRSNASILGQKNKNQKKAEQKKRKAANRRASEGDVSSMLAEDGLQRVQSHNISLEDVHHDGNDSGLASSVEEYTLKESCLKKASSSFGKKQRKSNKERRFLDESNSDLIFDLDF